VRAISLGPIYLCDKAPAAATWKSVEPGDPCPFCKKPLDQHPTTGGPE
jgi:hypothetical protein